MHHEILPLLVSMLAAKGDFIPILIVPLFFAFFIGMIALGIYQTKKAKERWQEFARAYGLTCNVGGWASQSHISGWFDGVYVHIGTVTRGSGKNRHTYTQFQAMLASGIMPYGLQVYQETVFSKVGVFFGGQDIQIGDPQLDAAFVFKGNIPNDVHRLVTIPAVKAALLDILARQPGFVLDANRVMVEKHGFVSDLATMYTTLVACVGLVQVLHGVCGVGVGAPQPAQKVPERAPKPAPAAMPAAAPKPAAAAPKPAKQVEAPLPGPKPDNTPRSDGGVFFLFDQLGDASLGSMERESLLEKLKGKAVSIPVIVDRVDFTSSFDVPDRLKDGRTVIGTINGIKTKVALRFPKARDRDISNLRRGTPITAQASVSGWDALFDRVIADAT